MHLCEEFIESPQSPVCSLKFYFIFYGSQTNDMNDKRIKYF